MPARMRKWKMRMPTKATTKVMRIQMAGRKTTRKRNKTPRLPALPQHGILAQNRTKRTRKAQGQVQQAALQRGALEGGVDGYLIYVV
jgi:hypothetical protein